MFFVLAAVGAAVIGLKITAAVLLLEMVLTNIMFGSLKSTGPAANR